MMRLAPCERARLDHAEAETRLRQAATDCRLLTSTLVYYPYLFCAFTATGRLATGTVTGSITVAVDLATGREALTDASPELEELDVTDDLVIPDEFRAGDAVAAARRFAALMLAHKLKVVAAPTLVTDTTVRFLRPFLVADATTTKDRFSVLIDLVSGSYHPLAGTAFHAVQKDPSAIPGNRLERTRS